MEEQDLLILGTAFPELNCSRFTHFRHIHCLSLVTFKCQYKAFLSFPNDLDSVSSCCCRCYLSPVQHSFNLTAGSLPGNAARQL